MDWKSPLRAKRRTIIYAEMQTSVTETAGGAEPVAFADHLTKLVEHAIETALSNMRELAEVPVKAQIEALTIISKRAMEHVEEMKALMRPKQPSRTASRSNPRIRNPITLVVRGKRYELRPDLAPRDFTGGDNPPSFSTA
jgi:phasin family protein